MDEQVLKLMEGILPAIKAMADNAALINTWMLSVTGGSILALVGSSYVKPTQKCAKGFYLLFFIGWAFFGVALYNGNSVAQSYNGAQIALAQSQAAFIGSKANAAQLDSAEKKKEIFYKAWANANNEYSMQIETFQIGLICFAIWMLFYLIWWIFFNEQPITTS